MQFQLRTQLFGVNKVTVDGNTYCSVFTGQRSTDPNVTKGLEVTKVSADPAVFDQVSDTFTPGDEVEFLAILKRAAGGKSQPYLVGIVPQSAPTKPAASAASPANKAADK